MLDMSLGHKSYTSPSLNFILFLTLDEQTSAESSEGRPGDVNNLEDVAFFCI